MNELILAKANLYISQIEVILDNYIEYPAFSINEQLFRPDDDSYEVQQDAISKLRVQIKLLFSEYVHGQIFLEEIKRAEESLKVIDHREYALNVMLENLKLMIEHIKEFSVEG